MTRAGCGLAVIAVVLTTAACDEKLSDIAGPTPNLEPTFSSIQQHIFNVPDSAGRPACTSCHNLERLSGTMNLREGAAYAMLVNVPSRGKPGAIRVIPGDPDGSYLIQKLEGAPGIVGDRMPLRGPFLTPGQILIIRRWIELGAPNN
jgi:hypothetical protein